MFQAIFPHGQAYIVSTSSQLHSTTVYSSKVSCTITYYDHTHFLLQKVWSCYETRATKMVVFAELALSETNIPPVEDPTVLALASDIEKLLGAPALLIDKSP